MGISKPHSRCQTPNNPNGSKWNDAVPHQSAGNAPDGNQTSDNDHARLPLGWEKNPPGLSLKQLMKRRQEGGINLLNIDARNQAINLMWLNTYIDHSTRRPLWAFALDAIVNCINETGITEQNDIHTFLTTLRPLGRP
jgi:hypothetical protein